MKDGSFQPGEASAIAKLIAEDFYNREMPFKAVPGD